MTLLPPFTLSGLLPAGDYPLTISQLRMSALCLAAPSRPAWDTGWRGQLVENLEIVVRDLWAAGIADIFIDGSFTEDKDHPNDIDGYFVCDLMDFVTGALERRLNRKHSEKLWTWNEADRRPAPGARQSQLPLWRRYRVDLWPHTRGALSGFTDAHGNELEFPAAFRLSRRSREPRGIIKIVR